MDELLTVAEAAATLRVAEMTVRNWIDQGKIGHYRAGGRRIRIGRHQLDEFIAGRVPSASNPSAEARAFWEGDGGTRTAGTSVTARCY